MKDDLVDQSDGRLRINSVGRAMKILIEIARSDFGLTPRELSQRLGIERQTIYHLLHTLSALSVVTKGEEGRMKLGLRVGELARAFERQFSAPEYLVPVVNELSRITGETCYAVGWWDGEIVTLAITRGDHAVQAAEVPRGQYGQAHARAAGKLLLATAPSNRRLAYLDKHAIERNTAATITDRNALDAEFARIRGEQVALDHEEFAEGVCCLAVPLGGADAPYALALSAPSQRFYDNVATYVGEARRLSAASREDRR